MKTHTQMQRGASAKIKHYVAKLNAEYPGGNLQYYFVRGQFHINNIGGFFTAKTICENATGLQFIHFTNSIAKLNDNQLTN